jgi:hypothetical protein
VNIALVAQVVSAALMTGATAAAQETASAVVAAAVRSLQDAAARTFSSNPNR